LRFQQDLVTLQPSICIKTVVVLAALALMAGVVLTLFVTSYFMNRLENIMAKFITATKTAVKQMANTVESAAGCRHLNDACHQCQV
jgi:hypothetical protein